MNEREPASARAVPIVSVTRDRGRCAAADLSADLNEPVDLPLTNQTISQIAEFKQKIRAGLNN